MAVAHPRAWHHGWVRTRTLLQATALACAAGLGYAVVIERNWFALRRFEVPVLPPGAEPLRILHISDAHLTPGRKRLMSWIRSLDDLDPDLVVNTGDSLAHPQSVRYFLDSLGPLLDRPGVRCASEMCRMRSGCAPGGRTGTSKRRKANQFRSITTA